MARTAMKSASKKKAALTDEQFLAVSRAVADPRRFAMLQQVAAAQPEGLLCSALQEHSAISPATISHHMKELADAGLVDVEREGRCSRLMLQREVWSAYVSRLSNL